MSQADDPPAERQARRRLIFNSNSGTHRVPHREGHLVLQGVDKLRTPTSPLPWSRPDFPNCDSCGQLADLQQVERVVLPVGGLIRRDQPMNTVSIHVFKTGALHHEIS